MYLVELEIKDTTESNTSASYSDLLMSVAWTVNLTLSFMTNVTISISTSQIFRSWVAIFQHRPPMASLFRSLYDIPGLAPRINVLFWERRDFQISLLNTDTSTSAYVLVTLPLEIWSWFKFMTWAICFVSWHPTKLKKDKSSRYKNSYTWTQKWIKSLKYLL